MSAIQKLLDDKRFWEVQALEFEAAMLDLVPDKKSWDSVRFQARLYLQHMRGMIHSRCNKYEEATDATQ